MSCVLRLCFVCLYVFLSSERQTVKQQESVLWKIRLLGSLVKKKKKKGHRWCITNKIKDDKLLFLLSEAENKSVCATLLVTLNVHSGKISLLVFLSAGSVQTKHNFLKSELISTRAESAQPMWDMSSHG